MPRGAKATEDAAIARAIATARKRARVIKRKSAGAPKAKAGGKRHKQLKAPAYVPRPKKRSGPAAPSRVSNSKRAHGTFRRHRSPGSSEEEDEGDGEDDDDDDDDDDESSSGEEGSDDGEGNLPEIEYPGAILVVGKKFAGKTNLIRGLVCRDKDQFDNIFLFTITSHKNNLNDLCTDPDMVLESVSDRFFEELLNHQRETNASTLLIFDDIVGLPGLGKQMPVIKQLAASCRNFNISIIFSTQDVTEVATTFRRNAEYFFFGHNVDGANEILAKQLAPPMLGHKAMYQKLKRVSENNDHEFFFISEHDRDFDTVKGPKML